MSWKTLWRQICICPFFSSDKSPFACFHCNYISNHICRRDYPAPTEPRLDAQNSEVWSQNILAFSQNFLWFKYYSLHVSKNNYKRVKRLMSNLILPEIMGTCLCYVALKMQGFFFFFLDRQWVSFGGGYVYQVTVLHSLYLTEKLQAHSCALDQWLIRINNKHGDG